MAFLKIKTLCKTFIRYLEPVVRGVRDGIVETVNIDRVLMDGYQDKSTIETLENCEPLSNHLLADARSKLENALTDGNLNDALGAIADGETPSAAPWCIAALKAGAAAICCSSGRKAVREATWNLISYY